MESKVNFALVGAFVLVLGAAFIAGVLWLSGGDTYRKSYRNYAVYMNESVSGLSIDAIVSYGGVQVGYVKRIELANDGERVRLTLDIEQGTPIKQDTVAVLRTQGLTGIAHIELSGGTRDSPLLEAHTGEPYPIIASGPSLMLRLDEAVTRLLSSLERSSESFNALLDTDNRATLRQTLVNLQAVSATVAQRSLAIDATLANAARAMERTAAAMENAAQLSERLPEIVNRIGRSTDALERMATEVARASHGVAGAVEGAGTEFQRFTSTTLPEARNLLIELRELSVTLRRLSEDLSADPALLLHGKPQTERGPGE